MNDTDLQRLAALFGETPFTSAEGFRGLDGGLGLAPSLRAFAASLRGAVGRRVSYGPRELVLVHAGTVHKRRRRWRFEVIAASAGSQADPDEDLL